MRSNPSPPSATSQFALRCAASLMLCALIGCGAETIPTYPAGGRIHFADGTPLDEGWIEFESVEVKERVSARGMIQPDGTFQLSTYEPGDGAVAGMHRAVITLPLSEAAALNPAAHPRRLAPRYSDYEQSGLRFEVQPDGSKNDFAIQVEAP